MAPWLRQALIFAAAFFAVNLLINFYRDGGITSPAFASALFSTAIATPIYVLVVRFLRRNRDR